MCLWISYFNSLCLLFFTCTMGAIVEVNSQSIMTAELGNPLKSTESFSRSGTHALTPPPGAWVSVETPGWAEGGTDHCCRSNLVGLPLYHAVDENVWPDREQLLTVHRCWQRCSSSGQKNRDIVVLPPSPGLPRWRSSQSLRFRSEQPVQKKTSGERRKSGREPAWPWPPPRDRFHPWSRRTYRASLAAVFVATAAAAVVLFKPDEHKCRQEHLVRKQAN